MKDSDFLKYAKSKIKAQAQARRLNLVQLKLLISSLNDVLTELKEKEASQRSAEKKANLMKIHALMKESGITSDDLKNNVAKNRLLKKRSKKELMGKRIVPAKYSLKIKGEEHLWAGRGRTPKVFASYQSEGGDLSSLLIKKS